MKCRVLESGKCSITQEFNNNHKGIDLVKEGNLLDNVVAHSSGTVIQVISNCNSNTPKETNNPGNMVKIDHGNGYYTRYLHLAYNTIKVKVGDKVNKGCVIGYMGNTGYSFGAHLHFEVLKDSNRINPITYLDKDLPIASTNSVNCYYRVKTLKHGWLKEVKNLEDYAGYENSPITDVAIRVDKGTIKYRVHIKGGTWLDYVTGYNINDIKNGYAGNGKVIDLVEVYYYTPDDIRPYKRAKYRVNNYAWQYDNEKSNNQDGYAGVIGKEITSFQMVIE